MRETTMSANSKTAKTVLLAGAAGLSCAALLAAAVLFASPRHAAANPAIAQKTGQPCGKCHTASPPALNSYGKSYKSKAK
jgi:hypothetical protein